MKFNQVTNKQAQEIIFTWGKNASLYPMASIYQTHQNTQQSWNGARLKIELRRQICFK